MTKSATSIKPANAKESPSVSVPAASGPLDFIAQSNGILTFLENSIWPLRLEKLLNSGNEKASFDSRVNDLLTMFDASPAAVFEWLAINAPVRKNGEGGENDKPSVVERIRLFGPQKTRAYLVGAYLRHQPEFQSKEKTDWLTTPLPSWRIFERIFGNEEMSFDLQLECGLIFEIFQGWLKAYHSPADGARTRRWLEKQIDAWVRLWVYLSTTAKSGTNLPSAVIFREQLLFDLGRATLIAQSDKIAALWSSAEKSKQDLFITLFIESELTGFCSAQMAAVWAQCLSTSSSLATPLRLLMRPWRANHSQLNINHALSVKVLAQWLERKIA